MQPLLHRVLIKLDNADRVSKGGIIIPDVAKERASQFGTVIAVGKGVTDIVVGDHVVIGKFSGTEIEILGKRHIMINDEDVLGRVTLEKEV